MIFRFLRNFFLNSFHPEIFQVKMCSITSTLIGPVLILQTTSCYMKRKLRNSQCSVFFSTQNPFVFFLCNKRCALFLNFRNILLTVLRMLMNCEKIKHVVNQAHRLWMNIILGKRRDLNLPDKSLFSCIFHFKIWYLIDILNKINLCCCFDTCHSESNFQQLSFQNKQKNYLILSKKKSIAIASKQIKWKIRFHLKIEWFCWKQTIVPYSNWLLWK